MHIVFAKKNKQIHAMSLNKSLQDAELFFALLTDLVCSYVRLDTSKAKAKVQITWYSQAWKEWPNKTKENDEVPSHKM